MGINFSLIAGGEPLCERKIAEVKDMIFPIFTNGTLIGPSYMKILKEHLNMVPIISIEVTAMGTTMQTPRKTVPSFSNHLKHFTMMAKIKCPCKYRLNYF